MYYTISEDQGIPGSEVYSIVQDSKGIIWIGCDAGIFRYNGREFQGVRSPDQRSQALTGLIISSTDKIYCYNFSGQLFYVDNSELVEIKGVEGLITSICADNLSNIWVTTGIGVQVYNEKSGSWKKGSQLSDSFRFNGISKNLNFDDKNRIWFLNGSHVYHVANSRINENRVDFSEMKNTNLMEYLLVSTPSNCYLLDIMGNGIMVHSENGFVHWKNQRLLDSIKNRKITNVKYLSDGNIWIVTFDGIIIYNENTGELWEYFKGTAFSDCIIDRENNVWLSTLTDGIYRIPTMNYLVWNKNSIALKTDKINGITVDENHAFFSQYDGTIGRINSTNLSTDLFRNESKSDIRAIQYFPSKKSVFYCATNNIFRLENDKITALPGVFPPVKAMKMVEDKLIVATSRGSYVYADLSGEGEPLMLTEDWSRDLFYDAHRKDLYLASNNGLYVFSFDGINFHHKGVLLKGTQIISVNGSSNDKNESINLLTFRGEIFEIQELTAKKISRLPEEIQGRKIVNWKDKIVCATNKGLWIYSQNLKAWKQMIKNDGICSMDIRSISLQGDHLWLATGKGVQRIPLNEPDEKVKGLVYLKSLYINEKNQAGLKHLEIYDSEELVLELEASDYSSGSKIQFAYRIVSGDGEWQILPKNQHEIRITNINHGDFEIELKAIDYKGQDSENQLIIKGVYYPVFYQRWWFYVLVAIAGVGLSYVIFLLRIRYLSERDHQKLIKLSLESQLNSAQQEAIKAQMNPHFIFNVLNSIKGFIYANDRQNASHYLNNFSDLIRNVLMMSTKSEVSLEDELDVLKAYIELEAMLLDNAFEIDLQIDETLDTRHLTLPPLLLQPFVENAFKHGFRFNTGKKNILIVHVSRDPESNCVLINISDNGIGRKAAAEKNNVNRDQHLSFATTASATRIKLLNENNKYKMSVRYMDHFFGNPAESGTTVELKMCLSHE